MRPWLLGAIMIVGSLRSLAAQERAPSFRGFALGEALSAALPRLGSCNPPGDRPAPDRRFCFPPATSPDALTLIFGGDSLVQISYGYWIDSTLANATGHWRERADSFAHIFGRPPDTTDVRPVRAWHGIDPRGDSAQVLIARWGGGSRERWCASVFIYDGVARPARPITRLTVDLYTDFPPHVFCRRLAGMAASEAD